MCFRSPHSLSAFMTISFNVLALIIFQLSRKTFCPFIIVSISVFEELGTNQRLHAVTLKKLTSLCVLFSKKLSFSPTPDAPLRLGLSSFFYSRYSPTDKK